MSALIVFTFTNVLVELPTATPTTAVEPSALAVSVPGEAPVMTLPVAVVVPLSSVMELVSAFAVGAVSVIRIPILLLALLVPAVSVAVTEIRSMTLCKPLL